jgi:hypothetical protein
MSAYQLLAVLTRLAEGSRVHAHAEGAMPDAKDLFQE